MTDECPLASVVVPTRNRAAFLPRVLAALDAQTYPAQEVIVVDDASTDGTPAILERWRREGRIAVRLPVPSGSYAARNRGWRMARGEIIAFTDDDCLPEPDWLAALVRVLGESERVVGAQGVTLAAPGEITPFTHQIHQTEPGPPYRTCNIAYRRQTLERLGGFDGSLRWYADNVFGLQARQWGPIGFAPDAVVLHPPRPREWRDRDAWLSRLAADSAHRRSLRRLGVEPVSPPRFALPVVLWIVRPLVKQSWAHLRYFLRRPRRYVHEVRPMIREKRDLLRALGDYWQAGRSRQPVPAGDAPLPPLPDNPLVSIIVVTRHGDRLLQDALAALERQTWEHREVVVVGHDAPAGTQQVAERPGARYVGVDGRAGLARARQAGVQAARGDIVAFTDDDCLANAGWLEALVGAFHRHPELWGVQGRTCAEPGPIGAHAVRVSHSDPLYQTCNIAYRRTAIERAGGFPSDFRGYFEDTALGASVLEHGPIGFEPKACVVHRAMPVRARDRSEWRRILRDERRLSLRHRAFYRRTRGPGFLSAVIARWLIGSPLKSALRELPQGGRQPGPYLIFLGHLLAERAALLGALADVLREPNTERHEEGRRRSDAPPSP